MPGIKIFFHSGIHFFLAALLTIATQSVFGQAKRDKGKFFERRLTTSTGLDYSLREENIPAAAGINFTPRLFLTTNHSDFSFSVETDIMANYRMDKNEEKFGKKIFLQLPALLHVNIGHGASKDFHSAAGGYLGAGWNVRYDGTTTVNGFVLAAGFRFWLLENSFTLSYTHLPGNEKIFSSGKIISLQINLGKYLANVKANNKVTDFMKPYRK